MTRGRVVRPDMLRALAFAILVLTAPISARAVGHERIPLDNWSYDAVERFETRGFCTLPEDRPFTRDEFIRIVDTIRTRVSARAEMLAGRDQYELERLEAEYTFDVAREDPTVRYDRALFARDQDIALEADFDVRAYSQQAPFETQTEFFLASDPTVKLHFGDRVTYDLRYRLVFGPEHGDRANDFKPSRRERSFNGLTALLDRSYVLATWSHVDLVVGREYVDWGPSGPDGGLITPGERYGVDQLGARVRFGRFRLDAFQGQLFGDPERWMVGHRLEATLGSSVIGLSETVVYNSRGLDMLYLLPLAWFYASQFNERDNDDNVIWSLDAKTNAIRGVTLYGSVLIDDFQYEDEGYPDKLAFDAGFRWVLSRPLGLSVRGQYRRVDIYTYSHADSLSYYVSGAGEIAGGDVLLGGVPGPDSDVWRIDAEVFPRPALSIAAGVFGTRAGEGRDLRNFELGVDDENPPFPSGVVDETVGFDVGARYEFRGDSWVSMTYVHASATNRGNVQGNDPSTDAFRLEIRWDIP